MIEYSSGQDALAMVTPRSLFAYLESHGWQRMDSYGNTGYIYGLEEELQEILVPSSPLADYVHRVSDLLETLSTVEDRDSKSVLRDISLSDFDLVRVRFPDASLDGSVPVETGVTLFQESRNLLLAAACSTSRPQRAFRAGRNQEAGEYMKSVRFGQTEVGSFVVNLLSPVPPSLVGQSDLSTGLPSEPFPRRVILKLVSGLRSASEAVNRVNVGDDIGAFEQEVPQGVSANLCDAIANLLDHNNRTSLHISVNWSLVRQPLKEPSQTVFREVDTAILKEASRILRDRQERPNERLDGYVFSLARGPSDHRGRVTLKAVIDGSMSSVRVDFPPPDYSRITDAHNQRLVVSLEGDLRREGQRWVLDNPRDLEIDRDDD